MLFKPKTAGELIEILKQYPHDKPLVSSGPDSGGYDCEDGTNIIVHESEHLASASARREFPGHLYIYHVDEGQESGRLKDVENTEKKLPVIKTKLKEKLPWSDLHVIYGDNWYETDTQSVVDLIKKEFGEETIHEVLKDEDGIVVAIGEKQAEAFNKAYPEYTVEDWWESEQLRP